MIFTASVTSEQTIMVTLSIQNCNTDGRDLWTSSLKPEKRTNSVTVKDENRNRAILFTSSHPFTHSPICIHLTSSNIYYLSSIYLANHLIIYPYFHSLIHSLFICCLSHSLIHLYVYSIYRSIHLFKYPSIYVLMNISFLYCLHPLIHVSIQSFIHPLSFNPLIYL